MAVKNKINFSELLLEYRGENFMRPLFKKLEELDDERNKIRELIKKNDLRSTSTDRHFKYVEECLDKAIKYSKLGTTALTKIGADD